MAARVLINHKTNETVRKYCFPFQREKKNKTKKNGRFIVEKKTMNRL